MKNKVVISLIVILTLIACKAPSLTVRYSKEISLKNIDFGQKEVFFIPMSHIGEDSYYSDISKQIDSMKSQGFKVYYESIANPIDLDSTSNDLSFRKLRKINGWSIFNRYNSETGVFQNGVQLKNEHSLKLQRNKELGIDEFDRKVDIPNYRLISLFEHKYGEIELSKCDYRTNLNSSEYKCKKMQKELTEKFSNEFILNLRNENLINEIETSNDQKILVVYGAGHFKGLKELIEK